MKNQKHKFTERPLMKIKRKTDKCSLRTVLFNYLKTVNLQKFSIVIPYVVHTILPFQSNFFLSGFSFTVINISQDSRGREGTIFYSTLPLPTAHAAVFSSIPFLSFILILDFFFLVYMYLKEESITSCKTKIIFREGGK